MMKETSDLFNRTRDKKFTLITGPKDEYFILKKQDFGCFHRFFFLMNTILKSISR